MIGRWWRWIVADPYRLTAAALLGVGAALRLLFLPEARFTGDEAFFFQEATRAAWGEWLPWVGPPVTGGPLRHPGGTFYLLMALPLTLSRSPLAAMGFVVALNTVAYGLLGAMVRRLMGPPRGPRLPPAAGPQPVELLLLRSDLELEPRPRRLVPLPVGPDARGDRATLPATVLGRLRARHLPTVPPVRAAAAVRGAGGPRRVPPPAARAGGAARAGRRGAALRPPIWSRSYGTASKTRAAF